MAKKKKPNPKLYLSERADLYFQRKYRRGTIPILLVAAALAAAFAYYNVQAGHGGMYYIVAAALAGLAVWQFIYTQKAQVSGEEVDQQARRVAGETKLDILALNATDMDIDDFDSLEKIHLSGYTTLPIDKEAPLLRADSEDQVGRSTHLQLSCFVLGKESMEAFSLVRSLLDQKKTQDNMTWRYEHIAQIRLEEVTVPCAKDPDGKGTENRKFPAVTIRSDNKRVRRTYAIDESCRARAEELVDRIQKQMKQ